MCAQRVERERACPSGVQDQIENDLIIRLAAGGHIPLRFVQCNINEILFDGDEVAIYRYAIGIRIDLCPEFHDSPAVYSDPAGQNIGFTFSSGGNSRSGKKFLQT